jgi:hypothetical protein
MDEFIKFLVDLQKKVDTLEQEVKDLKEGNTYNITINTHGCEKELTQKFIEKFVNGIKEKGTNF